MIKQMRQQGAYIVDIATQIGCSERTVRQWVIRADVPCCVTTSSPNVKCVRQKEQFASKLSLDTSSSTTGAKLRWRLPGNERCKVNFAVNTLGFSRRFHVFAAPKQDAEHTPEQEHLQPLPSSALSAVSTVNFVSIREN